MWLLAPDEVTWRNTIWSSSDGVNWQYEGITPWEYRGFAAAEVFRGRIWVMGGLTGDQDPYGNSWILNDVWSSPDGVNWTRETAAASWPARSGHASAVFNGRLWIFGGTGGGGGRDIWSYGLHMTPAISTPPPSGVIPPWDSAILPHGRVEQPYVATIRAREGDGPFQWILLDGELSPGLTLEESDTDTLTISGTPELAGAFTFTVGLEDAHGYTAEQTFTMYITVAASGPGEGGLLGCAAAVGWGGWVMAAGGPALALAAFLTIQALRPPRPRPRPKARRGSPRPRTR
jgi:hypothetical protein